MAEALFRKGVDDMKAGRFEAGCKAIDESHRLDPRPGALFTLAECNAKWGKIATAVAQYDDFLRGVSHLPAEKRVNYKDRIDDAQRQKEALAPRVPRLTVSVAGGLPPGARVTCDGLPLGPGALDLPLPLNPGDHELTIQQGDTGPVVRRAIRHDAGELKRLELPAPPPPPPAATPAPERSADAPASGGSGQRTAGYVVGGVGVAGLVVGAVAGALALSSGDEVERECPGRVCTDGGYDALDRAKTEALLSNIGLGVGAAGLVAGLVLVLTADASPSGPAASGALHPARGAAARARPLAPAAAFRPAFGAAPRGGWVGLGATF